MQETPPAPSNHTHVGQDPRRATRSALDDTRDAEAFSALYRRWHPSVVRLCRRIIGTYGDPEAVAQEAFIRAWQSWHPDRPGQSFWPWVAMVARRLSINESVSYARRLDILRRRGSVLCPAAEVHEAGIEAAADNQVVHQALRELDPRHRRLIELSDVDGWTYKQIAEVEGITADAVRGLLHRARRALRAGYERAVRDALVGWGLVGRIRAAGEHALRSAAALVRPVLPYEYASAAALVLAMLSTSPAPSTATPAPPLAGGQVASGQELSPSAGPPVDTARPASLGHVDPRRRSPSPRPVTDLHAQNPSRVRGVTASPSYSEDKTVFATTDSGCTAESASCMALYVSHDSGRSWQRLPASGLVSSAILLPPSYPRDPRIFAGPSALQNGGALQVSVDGGQTFETLAPAVGSATFSPRFSEGDPRILLGGGVLGVLPTPAAEYHDDDHTIRPLDLPLPPGAVAVSFAFGSDDSSLLVAGLQPEGVGTRGVVWRCVERACAIAWRSPDSVGAPHLLRRGRVVIAHTPYTAVRSSDSGRTFEPMSRPGDGQYRSLTSVGFGHGGALVASVVDVSSTSGGVYMSPDGGVTWSKLGDASAHRDMLGATVLPDGVILASPWQPGPLLCSLDGGATFADHC